VPGDYIVKFIAADGFGAAATVDVGAMTRSDSDADGVTGGLTGCYELSAGRRTKTSVDAGFYKLASHGRLRVERTTTPTASKTRWPAWRGQRHGRAEPACDADGQLRLGPGERHDRRQRATTCFSGLVPGDYKVEFVKPDGLHRSPAADQSVRTAATAMRTPPPA
jgi:hypothetical protein